MARFENALAITLKNEGGYFVNPRTGEIVNMGITLRTYQSTVDETATINTIRNLNLGQATAFYRKYFWDLLRLDQITDQTVANKIFDLGVNMGIGAIVRIVQRAVDVLAHPVEVDGRMGMLTIEAVNACDPTTLLRVIRSMAADHYRAIAVASPAHKDDLEGWLVRLAS